MEIPLFQEIVHPTDAQWALVKGCLGLLENPVNSKRVSGHHLHGITDDISGDAVTCQRSCKYKGNISVKCPLMKTTIKEMK